MHEQELVNQNPQVIECFAARAGSEGASELDRLVLDVGQTL